MSTTKRATPRTVPAARIESARQLAAVESTPRDHVNEAIGQLYTARGLASGARLLAARPRLTSPDDRKLRAKSASIARRALEALETCSRALGEDAPTLPALSYDVAEGHLKAASALLEATHARDEHDDILQALDLYELALEKLEASWHAALLATDAALARAAA